MIGYFLGVLAIAMGMRFLWQPTWRRDAVEKRIAEGDDRYFEEQRSYQAFIGWKNVDKARLRGVGLICLGCLLLILTYSRAYF